MVDGAGAGAGANSSMIYIPLDQGHEVLDAFEEKLGDIVDSSSSEDEEEDEDEDIDFSTMMDFNNSTSNPMTISSLLNQEIEIDDIGTPNFWEGYDGDGDGDGGGEENPERDGIYNVKPRFIFQDGEACELRERGLLRYIWEKGGRRWGRVSRDVMYDTEYYMGRERGRGVEGGFRKWEDLPLELKLLVLDFCGDGEVVSLAGTSKQTRRLAKGTVEKRQETFAKIPLVDESLAMIKYLGYTDEKADKLWSDWRRHEFPSKRTFLGHCLSPMLLLDEDSWDAFVEVDAWDESDDWRAVMDGWGLSEEFQDKVMDERFKDLRLTDSVKYWACKTVQLRWSTLKHLQLVSVLRVNPPMKFRDIRWSGTSAPVSWLQAPAELAPQTTQSEEEMTVLYQSINVVTAHAVFPPGERPYFRGIIKRTPFLDENGNLPEELIGDGSWPADFACWPNRCTMYPSRILAEKFAAYSAVRSYGHSPACLVKMSIPTRALKGMLRIKEFGGDNGDEEWKQVVWINRNEMNTGESLVTAQMADENVDLVVGKVSCNVGMAVVKMDEWEEISAGNVLMVEEDGKLQAAVQYSFLDEEWAFNLAESIRVEKVEL